MTFLPKPHGGKLIQAFDPNFELANIEKEIKIDAIALSDLELIGIGLFSPLTGFLGKEDYESVVTNMRLANNIIWSIPVTLPVSYEVAETLAVGEEYKLTFDNEVYGVIKVSEWYEQDLNKEAREVYKTEELAHPGVKRLFERGPVYVAGDVLLVKKPEKGEFGEVWFEPKETRALFEEKGWKTVVGFQTRNPIHRAHEYIQKAALETVDGLFVNPLVGFLFP
jgi:sulfate adenylyltransferase